MSDTATSEPAASAAYIAPSGVAPRRAMVLAAGLGTRMRPLTETTPKPLLKLAGRTLLDHALDRLEAAGVEQAVVNAHYLAPQVAALVAGRSHPRLLLQQEDILLGSAGGPRQALPLLGPDPFFLVNGDSCWLDGPTPILERMAAAFDPAQMDGLLLLVRAALVDAEVGQGDFALDPIGHVRRPKEREIVPYVFAGVQLVSPALLAEVPEGESGMMPAWERAIEAGRLFGLVHDGVWFHLSTPADLEHAEQSLESGLFRTLF